MQRVLMLRSTTQSGPGVTCRAGLHVGRIIACDLWNALDGGTQLVRRARTAVRREKWVVVVAASGGSRLADDVFWCSNRTRLGQRVDIANGQCDNKR